jgi:hypothetical protein
MMMTRGWRDDVWAELDRPWDVVVIGGGAFCGRRH